MWLSAMGLDVSDAGGVFDLICEQLDGETLSAKGRIWVVAKDQNDKWFPENGHQKCFSPNNLTLALSEAKVFRTVRSCPELVNGVSRLKGPARTEFSTGKQSAFFSHRFGGTSNVFKDLTSQHIKAVILFGQTASSLMCVCYFAALGTCFFGFDTDDRSEILKVGLNREAKLIICVTVILSGISDHIVHFQNLLGKRKLCNCATITVKSRRTQQTVRGISTWHCCVPRIWRFWRGWINCRPFPITRCKITGVGLVFWNPNICNEKIPGLQDDTELILRDQKKKQHSSACEATLNEIGESIEVDF